MSSSNPNFLSPAKALRYAVIIFGFLGLLAFIHPPKASANQLCASDDNNFARFNVYVRVVDSNGNLKGWGKDFSFNVTATTLDPGNYSDGTTKKELASVQKKRLLGNGSSIDNKYIPDSNVNKPLAAINNANSHQPYSGSNFNSATPSQSAEFSTSGNMHYCPGADPNGPVNPHPAFDFTNGSNGNPYLACLGGAPMFGDDSGYFKNVDNKYLFTASFTFSKSSNPSYYVDSSVASISGESGHTHSWQSGGTWLNTSKSVSPSGVRDVNGKDGDVIFVYQLPPPQYQLDAKAQYKLSSGGWSDGSTTINSSAPVAVNFRCVFWNTQTDATGSVHRECHNDSDSAVRQDDTTFPGDASEKYLANGSQQDISINISPGETKCFHSFANPWKTGAGSKDFTGTDKKACVTVTTTNEHDPSGSITCAPSGSSFRLDFSFGDGDGTSSNPVKAKINNAGNEYTAAGAGKNGSGSTNVSAGSYALWVLDVTSSGGNNGYKNIASVNTSSCSSETTPDGTISATCDTSVTPYVHRVNYVVSPTDGEGPVQVKVGTSSGGNDVSGGTLSVPSWTSLARPNTGIATYYLAIQDKKSDGSIAWVNKSTTFNPGVECPTLPAVLTPQVGITGPSPITAGVTVTPSAWVHNSESITGKSNWQCDFWFDTNGNSNRDGGESPGNCSPASGSNTTFPTGDTNVVTGPNYSVPAGTKQVCVKLTLVTSDPNTVISAPFAQYCTGVSNLPFLEVKNGDVNTTLNINTLTGNDPCTAASGYITTFWAQGRGSGTELAAFAGNDVRDFVSSALHSASSSLHKELTFANSGGPNGQKFNSIVGCSKDPDWNAPVNSASPVAGPASGGTKVINGNAYIPANVTYPSGSFGLASMPAFKLVVHGDIYINSGVTQLDGIYMATGTIYTCTQGNTKPTTANFMDTPGSCLSGSLKINGSLIAPNIKFLRVSGSLNTPAAESITYDPVTWLQALTPSATDQKIDAYTTLPPIL